MCLSTLQWLSLWNNPRKKYGLLIIIIAPFFSDYKHKKYRKATKKNLILKKVTKKVFLKTCGHSLDRETCSSPCLFREKPKDKTSEGGLVTRLTSEVPTFLVCQLSFSFIFVKISCYVFLFSARPLTVYNHFCFSEVRGKGINCMKKKRTNTSILKRITKTLYRMKILILCYFQNSGIQQCCHVIFDL